MYKNKFIIYIFIILIILTSGCTREDKNNNIIKQRDKAPDSLKDLSSKLDEILEELGEIEKIELGIDYQEDDTKKKDNIEEESKPEVTKEKEGEEEKSDSNKSDNKKGENKEENKGEDKENKDTKEPKNIGEIWKSIDKNLEQAHGLWNSYEVDRMEKGGAIENGNKFELSLNKMTKSIENRNIVDIYDFASQCYLNLKPFYDLYLDEYGGDISEIKYIIYRFYLGSITNDKDMMLNTIKGKDENINRIRIKLDKEDEEKMNKLNEVSVGLKNLEKILDEDSKRLYIIKKDTLIKNIKALE